MKFRTVEVDRGKGWQEIFFSDLCEGDNFRMFEPNGDPVIDDENNESFYATSNPYKNKDGIWTIDTLK